MSSVSLEPLMCKFPEVTKVGGVVRSPILESNTLHSFHYCRWRSMFAGHLADIAHSHQSHILAASLVGFSLCVHANSKYSSYENCFYDVNFENTEG